MYDPSIVSLTVSRDSTRTHSLGFTVDNDGVVWVRPVSRKHYNGAFKGEEPNPVVGLPVRAQPDELRALAEKLGEIARSGSWDRRRGADLLPAMAAAVGVGHLFDPPAKDE